MTSFAKVRKIVSKRKPERRIADRKRKIEQRRGEKVACALLEREVLESNTNYTYTTYRRMWEINMALGLARAFRNDTRWRALSREQKKQQAEDALLWLFPKEGVRGGWADKSVTNYGLGLNVNSWKRAGITIVSRVTDYLETLEEQTK